MKILAVDSSSLVASVAFVRFGNAAEDLLFEENSFHSRSDSSALFTSLETTVRNHGSPDAVCVGLGPGSYNGLRASISAIRAMATALGIPLHAIPSPLALPGPDKGFWAAGDARGGHRWVACVKGEAMQVETTLIAPSDVSRHLGTRPGFPVLGSSPLEEIPSLRIAHPSALLLARLAHRCDPVYLSPLTPEPLYLKPPHITAPKTAVSNR